MITQVCFLISKGILLLKLFRNVSQNKTFHDYISHHFVFRRFHLTSFNFEGNLAGRTGAMVSALGPWFVKALSMISINRQFQEKNKEIWYARFERNIKM